MSDARSPFIFRPWSPCVRLVACLTNSTPSSRVSTASAPQLTFFLGVGKARHYMSMSKYQLCWPDFKCQCRRTLTVTKAISPLSRYLPVLMSVPLWALTDIICHPCDLHHIVERRFRLYLRRMSTATKVQRSESLIFPSLLKLFPLWRSSTGRKTIPAHGVIGAVHRRYEVHAHIPATKKTGQLPVLWRRRFTVLDKEHHS